MKDCLKALTDSFLYKDLVCVILKVATFSCSSKSPKEVSETYLLSRSFLFCEKKVLSHCVNLTFCSHIYYSLVGTFQKLWSQY